MTRNTQDGENRSVPDAKVPGGYLKRSSKTESNQGMRQWLMA